MDADPGKASGQASGAAPAAGSGGIGGGALEPREFAAQAGGGAEGSVTDDTFRRSSEIPAPPLLSSGTSATETLLLSGSSSEAGVSKSLRESGETLQSGSAEASAAPAGEPAEALDSRASLDEDGLLRVLGATPTVRSVSNTVSLVLRTRAFFPRLLLRTQQVLASAASSQAELAAGLCELFALIVLRPLLRADGDCGDSPSPVSAADLAEAISRILLLRSLPGSSAAVCRLSSHVSSLVGQLGSRPSLLAVFQSKPVQFSVSLAFSLLGDAQEESTRCGRALISGLASSRALGRHRGQCLGSELLLRFEDWLSSASPAAPSGPVFDSLYDAFSAHFRILADLGTRGCQDAAGGLATSLSALLFRRVFTPPAPGSADRARGSFALGLLARAIHESHLSAFGYIVARWAFFLTLEGLNATLVGEESEASAGSQPDREALRCLLSLLRVYALSPLGRSEAAGEAGAEEIARDAGPSPPANLVKSRRRRGKPETAELAGIAGLAEVSDVTDAAETTEATEATEPLSAMSAASALEAGDRWALGSADSSVGSSRASSGASRVGSGRNRGAGGDTGGADRSSGSTKGSSHPLRPSQASQSSQPFRLSEIDFSGIELTPEAQRCIDRVSSATKSPKNLVAAVCAFLCSSLRGEALAVHAALGESDGVHSILSGVVPCLRECFSCADDLGAFGLSPAAGEGQSVPPDECIEPAVIPATAAASKPQLTVADMAQALPQPLGRLPSPMAVLMYVFGLPFDPQLIPKLTYYAFSRAPSPVLKAAALSCLAQYPGEPSFLLALTDSIRSPSPALLDLALRLSQRVFCAPAALEGLLSPDEQLRNRTYAMFSGLLDGVLSIFHSTSSRKVLDAVMGLAEGVALGFLRTCVFSRARAGGQCARAWNLVCRALVHLLLEYGVTRAHHKQEAMHVLFEGLFGPLCRCSEPRRLAEAVLGLGRAICCRASAGAEDVEGVGRDGDLRALLFLALFPSLRDSLAGAVDAHAGRGAALWVLSACWQEVGGAGVGARADRASLEPVLFSLNMLSPLLATLLRGAGEACEVSIAQLTSPFGAALPRALLASEPFLGLFVQAGRSLASAVTQGGSRESGDLSVDSPGSLGGSYASRQFCLSQQSQRSHQARHSRSARASPAARALRASRVSGASRASRTPRASRGKLLRELDALVECYSNILFPFSKSSSHRSGGKLLIAVALFCAEVCLADASARQGERFADSAHPGGPANPGSPRVPQPPSTIVNMAMAVATPVAHPSRCLAGQPGGNETAGVGEPPASPTLMTPVLLGGGSSSNRPGKTPVRDRLFPLWELAGRLFTLCLDTLEDEAASLALARLSRCLWSRGATERLLEAIEASPDLSESVRVGLLDEVRESGTAGCFLGDVVMDCVEASCEPMFSGTVAEFLGGVPEFFTSEEEEEETPNLSASPRSALFSRIRGYLSAVGGLKVMKQRLQTARSSDLPAQSGLLLAVSSCSKLVWSGSLEASRLCPAEEGEASSLSSSSPSPLGSPAASLISVRKAEALRVEGPRRFVRSTAQVVCDSITAVLSSSSPGSGECRRALQAGAEYLEAALISGYILPSQCVRPVILTFILQATGTDFQLSTAYWRLVVRALGRFEPRHLLAEFVRLLTPLPRMQKRIRGSNFLQCCREMCSSLAGLLSGGEGKPEAGAKRASRAARAVRTPRATRAAQRAQASSLLEFLLPSLELDSVLLGGSLGGRDRALLVTLVQVLVYYPYSFEKGMSGLDKALELADQLAGLDLGEERTADDSDRDSGESSGGEVSAVSAAFRLLGETLAKLYPRRRAARKAPSASQPPEKSFDRGQLAPTLAALDALLQRVLDALPFPLFPGDEGASSMAFSSLSSSRALDSPSEPSSKRRPSSETLVLSSGPRVPTLESSRALTKTETLPSLQSEGEGEGEGRGSTGV